MSRPDEVVMHNVIFQPAGGTGASAGGMAAGPAEISFDQYGYGASGASFSASMGSMSGAGGAGSMAAGASVGGAFAAVDPSNEPPLLEELGINFSDILAKSKAVLIPRSSDAHTLSQMDLAGPLLFCLAIGALLLLRGKLHFGYIYGVGVVGVLGMWALLNLMSANGMDLYRTTCVLGYGLLPMVLLTALAVFRPGNTVAFIAGVATVGWSAYAASLMFVTVLQLREQRVLVAYPVTLVYACFALMAIF